MSRRSSITWSGRRTWTRARALLASDFYGRIVEPNHLQRSLDILETMGTLESFDDLQEDLKRESAAMSHEARKRLFDQRLRDGL